jgi:hypothetical protein
VADGWTQYDLFHFFMLPHLFVTDFPPADSNDRGYTENIMQIKALLGIVFLLTPFISSAQSTRTPVLVELFTSEGCSSCPPADRLLATLIAQQPVAAAEIIVLEEHVDYWDQLGWHDRFSSPAFTDRQNVYASRLRVDSPYTPQMVVDGTAQFVGNDASKAVAAITAAAGHSKIPLSLSSTVVDGRNISATISTTAREQLHHGNLYVALVEPAATTVVRSGENGGRQLNHVSIARVIKRISRMEDLANSPVAFTVSAPTTANPSGLRLVVFAQLSDQGAIRGVVAGPVGR